MEELSQQTDHKYLGITGILNKLDNSVCDTFIDMLQVDTIDRPRQFAIAAVVIDPTNEGRFLAVKRPSYAKSLPDVWGLPAIIVKHGEQPEMAIVRLAWEKLNTQVEFLGCLGLASINRGDYELTLMDVVVRLVGKEPSVWEASAWEASTKQTKYVQQQWTDDLSMLQEAAIKGSICSRILLQSQGIIY